MVMQEIEYHWMLLKTVDQGRLRYTNGFEKMSRSDGVTRPLAMPWTDLAPGSHGFSHRHTLQARPV